MITERDVANVVTRLNHMMKTPLAPYVREGSTLMAQIGNYHLDHAYGGMQLCQMVNPAGGVRDVLGTGHITKRELYTAIHAYLRGIEDGVTELRARQAKGTQS